VGVNLGLINMLKIYNYHYALLAFCIAGYPIVISFSEFHLGAVLTYSTFLLFVLWRYLRCMIITEDFIEVVYIIRPFNRKTKIYFDYIETVSFRIPIGEYVKTAVVKYSVNVRKRKISLFYSKSSDYDYIVKILDEKKIPHAIFPYDPIG